MSWLLVAPIMTPMITACLVFLAPADRLLRGRISVLGAGALTVLGAVLLFEVWLYGPIAGDMGSWPAPFGITLVADLFSALMVFTSGLAGLAVATYALVDIDHERAAGGFDSFLQMLLAGVTGAFLTGDLFNLYVWFEVMLIASFALMVLGGDRRAARRCREVCGDQPDLYCPSSDRDRPALWPRRHPQHGRSAHGKLVDA